MTITQKEVDTATKLMKSALRGGVLVDRNGELCFDGDAVRFETIDGTQYARLCYDKEVRRWYFLIDSDWEPVDDTDFTKLVGGEE